MPHHPVTTNSIFHCYHYCFCSSDLSSATPAGCHEHCCSLCSTPDWILSTDTLKTQTGNGTSVHFTFHWNSEKHRPGVSSLPYRWINCTINPSRSRKVTATPYLFVVCRRCRLQRLDEWNLLCPPLTVLLFVLLPAAQTGSVTTASLAATAEKGAIMYPASCSGVHPHHSTAQSVTGP